MDNKLRVPYGLDEGGSLVHASTANPSWVYKCPCCSSVLTLKAGEVNVKHFSHRSDTNCAGESYEHETAKLLIAKVLNDLVDYPQESKPVTLVCSCECCSSNFPITLPKDSFSGADVEHSVGRFVCDVVAMKAGTPALAIEVHQTNPVNSDKAFGLPIPWIELEAKAIIQNPHEWHPSQSGNLKPVLRLCQRCRVQQGKLQAVAARCGQPLEKYAGYMDPSKATYIAAVRKCWADVCGKEFIAYWWNGVPFCESKPPEPRPKTIKYRYSKTYKGSYWANCCPHCGAIDGDNFLFLDLDGKSPFKRLPMVEPESVREERREAFNDAASYLLRNQ